MSLHPTISPTWSARPIFVYFRSLLSSLAISESIPLEYVLITLTALLFFALVLLLFLFFVVTLRARPRGTNFRRGSSLRRTAAVVVLGDVGRSPRMCLHARSLAREGWRVWIVGYRGAPPPDYLLSTTIKFCYLAEPPALMTRLSNSSRLLWLAFAPIKIALQLANLFWVLTMQCGDGRQGAVEVVIVQTPPAIPLLPVVQLTTRLLGSRLIIDWHNLAYTILALRLGRGVAGKVGIGVAKSIERTFGRCAYAHLFVTRALLNHLDERWNLQGKKVVLHDRPPEHFKRARVIETHELFTKLTPVLDGPLAASGEPSRRTTQLDVKQPPARDEIPFFPTYSLPHSTPFTTTLPSWSGTPPSPIDGRASLDTPPLSPSPPRVRSGAASFLDPSYVELRSDRPALVVSSTSWTPDEDFSILLDALSKYEEKARDSYKRSLFAGVGTGEEVGPARRGSEEEMRTGAGRVGRMVRKNSASNLPSFARFENDRLEQNGAPFQRPTISTSLQSSSQRSVSALSSPVLSCEPDSFSTSPLLPNLLVVITGRGPMLSSFLQTLEARSTSECWERVRVRTLWLEAADYPILLGSADVGVSLHTSSSGLDLPMKVVDMLGCGVPVCAVGFPCLDELIQPGRNGLIFDDAEGLANHLDALLLSHPEPTRLMSQLRNAAHTSLVHPDSLSDPSQHPFVRRTPSWDDNWRKVVGPLLEREEGSWVAGERASSLPPSSRSHARTRTDGGERLRGQTSVSTGAGEVRAGRGAQGERGEREEDEWGDGLRWRGVAGVPAIEVSHHES